MPELIVVGGGPAGLTAAFYAVRRRLEVLLVSPELGGQTRFQSALPGFEEHRIIRGGELVDRFARELEYLGYPLRAGSVVEVRAEGVVNPAAAGAVSPATACDGFRVRLAAGVTNPATAGALSPAAGGDAEELSARAVILATGSRAPRLGVPGEAELFQKGLYGSAASYAHLFLDKSVLVVGDGPRARAAAAQLAASGARVRLLQSGEHVVALRGGPGAVQAVLESPAGQMVLSVDGVFNEQEPSPNSGPVAGLAELDGSGYVRVDARCRSSRQGLFAAGDVTDVHREQVLVAIGEGAKAFLSAAEYLEGR
jgi:alkyl hydroperoxide reductase subunit F